LQEFFQIMTQLIEKSDVIKVWRDRTQSLRVKRMLKISIRDKRMVLKQTKFFFKKM
jgi:hypothetical protein